MFGKRFWRLGSLKKSAFGNNPCYSKDVKANLTRSSLTNNEVRVKRSRLFDEEAKRQAGLIARFEKIQVKLVRPQEKDLLLIMNKHISTPLNCAMHVSETLCKLSAVALVNGSPWDMNRPLKEDCELKFLHFKSAEPHLANITFWRSCSFLLGLTAERAFKDDLFIELHSWPAPNVESGSFVYDIDLKVDNWHPTKGELRAVSIMGNKYFANGHPFQVLDIDASLALKLFEDNRFKHSQIPFIASKSKDGHTITVYKVDDHVDVSQGPMISNTNLVGRFMLTAVYPLNTDFGVLHRFQGVSLPTEILIHHIPYSIIADRAAKVNPSKVPTIEKVDTEERLLVSSLDFEEKSNTKTT